MIQKSIKSRHAVTGTSGSRSTIRTLVLTAMVLAWGCSTGPAETIPSANSWWQPLEANILAELNVADVAGGTDGFLVESITAMPAPWRLVKGAFRPVDLKAENEAPQGRAPENELIQTASKVPGHASIDSRILEADAPTELCAGDGTWENYVVTADVMLSSGKPVVLSVADKLEGGQIHRGYLVAVRDFSDKTHTDKTRMRMACTQQAEGEGPAPAKGDVAKGPWLPFLLQADFARLAALQLPDAKVDLVEKRKELAEKLRQAESMPNAGWDKRWIQLRIELTPLQVRLWVNGILAGAIEQPQRHGGFSLALNKQDRVRAIRAVRMPQAVAGFLPLDLTARFNNDGLQGGNLGDGYAFPTTPLPGREQFIIVDNVPFYWSVSAVVSNNLDVSRATVLRENLERYFSTTATDGDARRVLLKVPRRQYNQLTLIAASDSRATVTDRMIVRMIKPGRANYLDADAQVPRWDESHPAVEAIPVPIGSMWHGSSSTTQTGRFWLIHIPLDPGAFQDCLGDKEVEIEKNKEAALTIDLTSLAGNAGVHIFAATLRESPVELQVTSGEIGHVFVQPQIPAFNVILRNRTPNVQSGHLDVTIRDFYDKTNVQSVAYSVPALTTVTNVVTVPCEVRGLHYIDVRLLNTRNETGVRRQTTFALLPPDTRHADRDSPFGMWTFNAGHYGGGKAASSALLSKIGVRWAFTHSDPEKKIYPAFQDVMRIGGSNEAAFVTNCVRYLPVGHWSVFAEVALSYGAADYQLFPPELLEEPTSQALNETESKRFQNFWNMAVTRSEWVRKHYPDKPLIFGNGYPRFIAAFLANGYPRRLLDGFALDYVGDRMDLFFYLREVAKYYGYGDVPLYITEGFYVGSDRSYYPDKSSEMAQSDRYIRGFLRGFAIGFGKFLGASEIWDNGGTYYYGGYGPVGLCHRAPELNPKPGYVAYGTMTLLLDQAKFHSLVPLGSLNAYMLRFDGPRGPVYAAWTARGRRNLIFAANSQAKPRLTDSQGNSRPIEISDGQCRIEATPTPVYIEEAGVIAEARVDEALYDTVPGPGVKVVYQFADAATWQQTTNTCEALEKQNSQRPIRQMPFDVRLAEGRAAGEKALAVTLRADPIVSPHRRGYSLLQPLQDIVIDAGSTALCVWVYGNGAAWLDLEARDAKGKTWHTVTPPPTFEFGMRYGEGLAFDGWRYIVYPWSKWHGGKARELPAFPLKLTALILEQYSKVLYINRLESPPDPTWRIGPILAEYASPAENEPKEAETEAGAPAPDRMDPLPADNK